MGSRGLQLKGKERLKRAGKCYNREMNEEYRGGRGPRIFKEEVTFELTLKGYTACTRWSRGEEMLPVKGGSLNKGVQAG